LLTIDTHGSTLKVSTHPDFVVQTGEKIWLRFPVAKIRWIDKENGHAIVPEMQKVL
jgi:hypothetical protein